MSISRACATAARSGSTASASRTSRRIPAFRNTVRMIARLYDALHDPARKDVLTIDDRHRQRRLHAPVLQGAAERRGAGRRARRHRRMGARHLRLDRPQPRLQGGVPGHARRQRRLLRAVRRERPALVQEGARKRSSFVNHAIVNPPVDRDKPLDEVKDVYMHVEKETDAGLIVSGAKVVATTSTLTHYNFIANNGALPIKTKEFAFVCMVPTDAPGVKLFCRPSYEMTAGGRWARRSTTRSRAAWTRTTRSSCSTRCSCPGRTCSPTATSTRSTTSSRARASCRASCSRAARASR